MMDHCFAGKLPGTFESGPLVWQISAKAVHPGKGMNLKHRKTLR